MTYQAREKTEFYVRLRQMAPSEACWTSQARQQQEQMAPQQQQMARQRRDGPRRRDNNNNVVCGV